MRKMTGDVRYEHDGKIWKFHPLPDPPPPPPFTITQQDWDTLMHKLDKFTIGLMNTLERIKLTTANIEAQLESKGFKREAKHE